MSLARIDAGILFGLYVLLQLLSVHYETSARVMARGIVTVEMQSDCGFL